MSQEEKYLSQYKLQEEESIDIKKYIFIILSHWWLFAISIFIALTIAYMVNRYTQEIYTVSCSIIVGEEKSGTGSIESVMDELSRVRNKKRKAVVENEISILKSYKLARLALEELDFNITYIAVGRRNIAEKELYHNSPFIVVSDSTSRLPWGVYDVTILSTVKYRISIGETFQQELAFGQYFERNGARFKIILRDPKNFEFDPQISNKYYFVINSTNALANAMRNTLTVQVNDEKGSILTMSMKGFVPTKISAYLNKLSEVYIRTNLEEKNITSVNTISFIDDQLRGVVDSLETTGLKLQRFRSANKVINLSAEGAFLFQKLQDLQSEKAMLDIRGRYYQYLLEYVKERTDFSDVVAPSVVGIQDELLNSLVAQLNQLNMDRRNLSMTLVDNSPQLLVLNNQIINIRNALEENLKSLLRANSISGKEVEERIVGFEKQVQKLPGTERQLIDIEREFTINDQIYTFLLQKRAEAGITRASNTSDHKQLDIARPENIRLIKPNSSRNYITGVALGGLIPLALLIIIEFFNDKIISRKDIELRTNVPILGSIGHNEIDSEVPAVEMPKSALAESFRALRTNLQYKLKGIDPSVISVSSTISGEGKTFCAVNLATIMAMAGEKTLLVSLDLRRPKIHKIFNIENDEGISTYLIGKSSLKNIIHKTNIENLSVATAGPIPPNPAELIGSKEMKEFFGKLKPEFNCIILDTPPVGIVTDALLLSNYIDTHIFVVRNNYTTKQSLQLVDELYHHKGFENLSLLVNDAQVKGYYGYGQGYGYGYGYGYNYYTQGYYEDENPRENLTQKMKKIFSKRS